MPVRALTAAEQILFAEVLSDFFPFLADSTEEPATIEDLAESLKELYSELAGESLDEEERSYAGA